MRPRVLFALLVILLGTVPAARAGTPIGLYEIHAGQVNFVGTAGSLRRDSNLNDACAVDNYDTATLAGIPAGASVKAAYLYWAGSYSRRRGTNQRTPDWDITFEGNALTADRQFTERYRNGGSRYDFFSGMCDVTGIVATKGNGLYTFGNLDVNTGSPHCDVQAVLAGWSLIVVYEHPGESNRVVNVFDGFEAYRGGQIGVTVDNFQISASDINGKVGHLTWEGDAENSGSYNGFNESLTFNGNPLVDGLNPANNQFNSTVNSSGRTDTWGVDLDIYDVTPYLNAGDTSASTIYRSGQDLVLLSAEVVSVTNVPIVDLTFTAAPDDPLGLFEPGQIRLDLVNNGPSTDSSPLTLTVTLPPGLTYTGTQGGAWSVVDSGLPTLVYTHPGPLAPGQSLPLVFDVVPGSAAVGTPDLTVSVSSGAYDPNPGNNSGLVPLNVVVPAAELVSASYVETIADPVNGTANPKAIPGAAVVYTLTTTNHRAGAVDLDTVEIINPLPPGTSLYVLDFSGPATGPVLLVEGSPASGLTLAPGGGSLAYSADGGATFGHTPAPDAQGYDAAITHLRVRPSGTFLGRTAVGPSGFSLKYQVLVR